MYSFLQFSQYFCENFPGYSLSPLRMSISRLESLFGTLKFQAHGSLSAGNYGSSLGRVKTRRELNLTSRALSHDQRNYRDQEALVSGPAHTSTTPMSNHPLPTFLPVPAHYVPYGYHGVKEFIFPVHISQSTLQGKEVGSSACTIIALAMGQKFYSGVLEEPQKVLDQTWFQDMVQSISQGSTKAADIKTAIAPDHKAIRLFLQFESKKKGPGLWKFNNSLLNDDTFVDLITTNYPIICRKYAYLTNLNLKWEMIKMEIRSLTIPYAKKKARNVRNLEKQLESRIESLESKINANPDDGTDAEQQEYERLKTELRRIYEKRADGAILRSKIRWIEHGEKPTKYFFNMERRNYNKKTITELTVAGGTTISNDDDILEEIRGFYENLYKTDLGEDSTSLFQGFTENLRTKLPKLTGDQRDLLEGKLTLEECRRALMCLRRGKSPGEDGFTVEFYQFFFELLGQELLDSINASYDDNELSISQRRGVITLIPKEDANLKDLSNWRPITLLNVDYKIASKAIATRIEKVLPLLINSNQTGFVKGRYIGENIRLINDMLEQTKAQDIPGILLLLDFRKAFDTVEWGFIQNTLDLFNFGSNIKQWVRTFYNNTESSVLHNGYTTNYFKLSRGVRQGCPLSPYLFILGAEILAARVRLERNIEGITILNTEHKISQFADDTSLFLKNIDSITNAIEILRLFGNISGLKLNLGKTKAIWLGSWRHKENKPLGLNWTNEPVRALGIFISYNEQENDKKNVAKKIDNLNIKLDLWRGRKLSPSSVSALLSKPWEFHKLFIQHPCLTSALMTLPELRSPFLVLFGTRNQIRSKEILCAKTI